MYFTFSYFNADQLKRVVSKNYDHYLNQFDKHYILKIRLNIILEKWTFESLSHVRLFATPWTTAARLLCSWDSSGKNTGVGSHSLLQWIFPAQESNLYLLYLLHCRRLQVASFTVWVNREDPIILETNWHSLKL